LWEGETKQDKTEIIKTTRQGNSEKLSDWLTGTYITSKKAAGGKSKKVGGGPEKGKKK